MNLDELQSVQARERQSSDLQHLRSAFYAEVGEYISGLAEERSRAVERADDPFSAPEVRKLSDDIETAEQTVEAIYERRVGKVVKKASIAAAGMPVDAEGLTQEEEALFDDLVARIEQNRESVLAVLDGEVPSVPSAVGAGGDAEGDAASGRGPARESGPESRGGSTADEGASAADEGVSAADLMGDDASGSDAGTDEDSTGESNSQSSSDHASGPGPAGDASQLDSAPSPEHEPAPDHKGSPEQERPPTPEQGPSGESVPAEQSADRRRSDAVGDGADGSSSEGRSPAGGAAASGEREVPGIPRTTVRITADVGEVVGADDRDYDLGAEDVVTLPEPNADVLVEKDAAERLE